MQETTDIIDLQTAKTHLSEYITEYSYTLWAGAGLTKQLGSIAGTSSICDWSALVELAQKEAGLAKNIKESYPDRLQECLDVLGRERFQQLLRREILTKLCSIISSSSSDPPKQFQQIAQLGKLANPIINFNIEHLTSLALAMPGGPCAVRCFRRDINLQHITNICKPGKFQRLIYHPHGLINHSGLCVMTTKEYASLKETLALRMAVHAAFDSVLFIVGMSLEDAYLRRQLELYHANIFKIVWFAVDYPERFSIPIRQWVKRMTKKMKLKTGAPGFTVVNCVTWPKFWGFLDHNFPRVDKKVLVKTWQHLQQEARDVDSSRRHSPNRISLGLI